jgi:hypothetical protein
MKTALFTSTFLHGNDDASPLPRTKRATKFLEYYRKIQDDLGFDQIYVSDNGGTGNQIAALLWQDQDIKLIRHPYIVRGIGHPIYDALPCWRAAYDYAILIADGYEKIITTDDDAYILSGRFMDHIRNLESGYETYWCPKYGFPEGALSVLCKDAFPVYQEFIKTPYAERNFSGRPPEEIFPFTKINKSFQTDRWGETRTKQDPSMDGYFQCPADLDLIPKMSER